MKFELGKGALNYLFTSVPQDALLREDLVCTTGLVKAEIIRNRKEFSQLKDYFDVLPLLADPVGMWDEVITAQRRLKTRGVNGVGIPDLIIAVTAIANDAEVFSKDHHFDLMEKILDLEMFRAS
jgi:predicted nucleic acid-binding protein